MRLNRRGFVWSYPSTKPKQPFAQVIHDLLINSFVEKGPRTLERRDRIVQENDYAQLLLDNDTFHHLQARATHNAFIEDD